MKLDFYKIGGNKKKVIIVDENQKNISKGEFDKKIKTISNFFYDYSVIVIIADNCLDFIAGYLAALNKKNTITILLDKSFSLNYIEKVIGLYKPNIVFSPLNLSFSKLKILSFFNLQNYKILNTNFNLRKNYNFSNFLLLSTSGTTESPKFVRLSKKNIEDNTIKIIKYLNIKKNQTTITTMPAGYSYGLSILNSHLKVRSKIVLNNNSIIEKSFWEKMKKFKVNSFGGVPEFYEFLRKLNFKKYVNKNMKYLTQAGGKLNEKDLEYFGKICKKNKIKFYVMYGQTEASPRISFLEWKFFFKNLNSIGKPLKGYKLKIFNRDKEIKRPNKTGELVLFGKNVCLGYANNFSDLKRGDENKNILRTGDLGFKDKKNFFYITGRLKKIVKIFGKRYDLNIIESFVREKGYKINCYLIDKKLNIQVEDVYKADIIIDLISVKFSLNKNLILINKNKVKTLKSYN
tara:strand:- start:33216 stop:34595 length:1380 start_codon:yes stop_codon:yes gene_type:complete